MHHPSLLSPVSFVCNVLLSFLRRVLEVRDTFQCCACDHKIILLQMFVGDRPPSIVLKSLIPMAFVNFLSNFPQHTLALIISTRAVMFQKQIMLRWFPHCIVSGSKCSDVCYRASQKYFVVHHWGKLASSESKPHHRS